MRPGLHGGDFHIYTSVFVPTATIVAVQSNGKVVMTWTVNWVGGVRGVATEVTKP